MAKWIIGDVHGCWVTLQRLLDRIKWDPAADHLCFVGDLVNKGRHSLEVLRWVSSAGPRVGCVLGNLDLHLLARSEGCAPARLQDTIDPILTAPDRDAMLFWLRRQPFVRRLDKTVVVHAGFMPSWRLSDAEDLAARCSEEITTQGLVGLWNGRKERWQPGLRARENTAAAAGVLTRIRMVDQAGMPLLTYAGGLEDAPEGSKPWFEGSALLARSLRVVFGHWACLGFKQSEQFICLDSGCVYGGALSAIDVDAGHLVQEICDPKDRLS